MLQYVTESMTLELMAPAGDCTIYAKQGDHDTRAVDITLTAHGTPYSIPMEAGVVLRAMKPDGTLVIRTAERLQAQVVRVVLTDQLLAVPGQVVADLQVVEGGKTLASGNFRIEVTAAPTGEEIASESQLLLFQQLVMQGQDASGEALDRAVMAQRYAEQAESFAGQTRSDAASTGQALTDARREREQLHRELIQVEQSQSEADRLMALAQQLLDSASALVLAEGAGVHNSCFRGKQLGTAVTQAQYDKIRTGSFSDLYIGDYWLIGGIRYRIAAFDYCFNSGDTPCTKHHALIVPDSCLDYQSFHGTDTTAGGYAQSDLRKTGLTKSRNTALEAFPGHVLTYRSYLNTAVSNGIPTTGAWMDCAVELLSEPMLYGHALTNPTNNGKNLPKNQRIEMCQLPLFRLRPDLTVIRENYWLRDAASDQFYVYAVYSGGTDFHYPNRKYGIRPFFLIGG